MNDYQHFYISDPSYARLRSIAEEQLYIKKGSKTARGLSAFLADLSNVPMKDNRPEHIIERHNAEIASMRAPNWCSYHIRVLRLLQMPKVIIYNYVCIAYEIGILQSTPWLIGGPSRVNPVAITSVVLEALGLEYIVPITNYPIKQRTFHE